MFDDRKYTEKQPPLSIVASRLILLWIMSVLAASTVLTHVSQLLGLSFELYSSISLFVFLVISVLIGRFSFRRLQAGFYIDTSALVFLLILGFIGAGLSLASRNPDSDDIFYVPNVVYYIDNPTEAMGFTIHYLDGGDEPLSSIAQATSQPIDYFRGVIANLIDVNFLWIYYHFTKAIIGFLIPLSLFLIITHFSENTFDAAIATGITVGILLLQGETHKTFGRFMFTRAFQGKTLLFSVGIPLFTYATLTYFGRPNSKSWILLFVTATALTGASSSTLFLIPSLALVLPISLIFVSRNKTRILKNSILYFTSMIYLFLWGLFLLASPSRAIGFSTGAAGDGQALIDYARGFIRPERPVTLFLLIGASVLSILLAKNWKRGFLSIWMVSVLLLFFSPWSFRWLENTIGPRYWRMFYVLPYPLVVGVITSAVHFKIRELPNKLYIAITVGIFLGLTLLHFPRHSTSIFRTRNSKFGYIGFDIADEKWAMAHRIIQRAPAGAMLSPSSISGTIVMLDSNYPQIAMKFGLQLWFGSRGEPEEADQRIAAREFIEGKGNNIEAFQYVIEQSQVQSVVISNATLESPGVVEFLEENQFMNNEELGPFTLFWR